VERAQGSGNRRATARPASRPGIRLGIGAGSAIVKLFVAAVFSVLVVLSLVERWNVFLIIVLGAIWAIVFAGLIVVPIIASFIADSLSQHGRAEPFRPPDLGIGTETWATEPWPPAYPPLPGAAEAPQATRGPMARQLAVGMASGFDWAAVVEGVAERLAVALGDGYAVRAEGTSLVLEHGEALRKVSLGSIFQPPPLEVGERALRGCLKMMDEAQMFSMRIRQAPWPTREGSLEGAPGNLARPRVRLDDSEIRMVWADSWGTVLRLRPLPFEAAPSARDATW
jgi:hypothetical protein